MNQEINSYLTSRSEAPPWLHTSFAAFLLATIVIFWMPLRQLVSFAATHDYGSHIFLVVPVSAFFIYIRHNEVFSTTGFNFWPGLALLGTAVAGELIVSLYLSNRPETLSLMIFGLVLIWLTGFVLCYGTAAFRKACFPLLFLFLLVPLPDFAVTRIVTALQDGSTAVAYYLLRTIHIPAIRDGFMLRLPQFDLHVEQECSGIRSSLALLVTVLVASQFILRSSWRKLLLVLTCVPVLVIKNGIRIVSIYVLATRVDAGFLHGKLHSSGGIVFYFLGMAALVPTAIFLHKGEAAEPN